MQRLISTHILPERDQFSYWREECMKHMVGVTLGRGSAPDIARHGYDAKTNTG